MDNQKIMYFNMMTPMAAVDSERMPNHLRFLIMF